MVLCLFTHYTANATNLISLLLESVKNSGVSTADLEIEITESRINISCPECTEKFHPNDIRNILQNPSLMDKYEDFMVRRVLVSDPDARWCPAPDCG